MTWIQTFTGKRFYPLDPHPDDICIEDIAHALSLICRYNGHCNRFYSVAEHSVLMCRYISRLNLPPVAKLITLLHDSAEGLGFSDLPKPVKSQFPEYERAEKILQRIIMLSFGIDPNDYAFCYPTIKKIDTRILMDERAQLFDDALPWSTDCEPLGIKIECWSPEKAERLFLKMFYELKGD